MNHFSWSQVQKINFEGKMFIIHVILNEVISIILKNNCIHYLHLYFSYFLYLSCILMYSHAS